MHIRNARPIYFIYALLTISGSASRGVSAQTMRHQSPAQEATIPAYREDKTSAIVSLAFSPDGKTLAGGSVGQFLRGRVTLWDVATARKLTTFEREEDREEIVRSVAFSPNGTTLASTGSNGAICLWDVPTSRLKGILLTPAQSPGLTCLAYSPDGETLAAASMGRTITLWDVSTRRIRLSLRGLKSIAKCIAYSPDGRLLASGGSFDPIRLWDAATGEVKSVLSGQGTTAIVAFSPDGTMLASTGDKTILIQFVREGSREIVLRGHTGSIKSLAFSPDGKHLLSIADDSSLRLWDMNKGEELGTFKLDHIQPLSLAFSANGKIIAVGGYSNHEMFGVVELLETDGLRIRRR